MSTPLAEWEDLAADWQTADEGPVDVAPLRRLLAAQRRRLVAVVLGEAALVLAFGWLSWLVVRDGVEAWEVVWLLTLWGFTVVAVGFALWNRRGTWRSLGESVEEYVRLARLRAQRARASLVFSCGLLAAEVLAVVAQLIWFGRANGPLGLVVGSLLVAAISVVAGGCWLAARRIRRELALLDELSRQEADD